jgi:hypothetical protein
MTGQVNWSSVGQSAIGGALGGAFSFGVGQMFGHGVTDIGQFATKTVAHGVSGGLQNMIQGGDFGSGMLSGSVGHATGFVGESIGGNTGGLIGSGVGGGTTAALSGGDFGRGFQMGVMQYGFNYLGEGVVGAGMDFISSLHLDIGGQAQLGVMSGAIGTDGKGLALEANPGLGASVYVNAAPKNFVSAQTMSYGISRHMSVSVSRGYVGNVSK